MATYEGAAAISGDGLGILDREHTIAKAGGASDVWLEDFMRGLKDSDRAAGENAARLWLAHAAPRG